MPPPARRPLTNPHPDAAQKNRPSTASRRDPIACGADPAPASRCRTVHTSARGPLLIVINAPTGSPFPLSRRCHLRRCFSIDLWSMFAPPERGSTTGLNHLQPGLRIIHDYKRLLGDRRFRRRWGIDASGAYLPADCRGPAVQRNPVKMLSSNRHSTARWRGSGPCGGTSLRTPSTWATIVVMLVAAASRLVMSMSTPGKPAA